MTPPKKNDKIVVEASGPAVLSKLDHTKRATLPIRVGSVVRVQQKVKEKSGKIRLQAYEGLVIAVKHGKEMGGTFTVRRVSSGVGMEKVFPLYSPNLEKIEVLRQAKTKKAKLYYVRDKSAKAIRRKMRGMIDVIMPKEEEPLKPEDMEPEKVEEEKAEDTPTEEKKEEEKVATE